jgi:hypothetical protein
MKTFFTYLGGGNQFPLSLHSTSYSLLSLVTRQPVRYQNVNMFIARYYPVLVGVIG